MTTNPYQSPQADSEPAKGPSITTWVTATVGALLVLLGAFIALQLLGVFLVPWAYQSATGVVVSYLVTVPLAIAAAVLSFRATVRIAK